MGRQFLLLELLAHHPTLLPLRTSLHNLGHDSVGEKRTRNAPTTHHLAALHGVRCLVWVYNGLVYVYCDLFPAVMVPGRERNFGYPLWRRLPPNDTRYGYIRYYLWSYSKCFVLPFALQYNDCS